MDTILKFKSTADLVDLIDYGSMAEVVKATRSGWSEGVSAVLDLLHSLSLNIEPEKFQKEFFPSIKGLFYDIGLVCSGVPEHWFSPHQTEDSGSFVNNEHNDLKRVINLNINTSFLSNIKDSTIIERGAAVVVLAYLLEQSGRSVSISQYCATTKNNQGFYGSVTLKEANQPLDLEVLAFWLVCPDSFYKCWYRIMENIPNAFKLGILNGQYGVPEINYGKENSDVFLKGINNNTTTWSREDSVNWIKEALVNLNINFN